MGCHSEVKKARWTIPCLSCMAEGRVQGKVCPECNGMKKIPQSRCPLSQITDHNHQGFRFYCHFKNYNILPESGGMAEQSSYFLKVLEFCETVTNLTGKLDDEHKQRVAMMNSKAGKDGF